MVISEMSGSGSEMWGWRSVLCEDQGRSDAVKKLCYDKQESLWVWCWGEMRAAVPLLGSYLSMWMAWGVPAA